MYRQSKCPYKRCIVLLVIISLFTGLVPVSVFAAEDGSSQKIYSAATDADTTKDSVDKVASLAQKLYSENKKSDMSAGEFTWDTEGKERSWTYYNGIMMDAFLMLDSDRYLEYVNRFYDANITSGGQVNSSSASDNYYRESELDSIPPTRALFDLIRANADASGKYKKMIYYVYNIMDVISDQDAWEKWVVHSGDEELAGGNFYHKPGNSKWADYQVALDGLYMAQPFFMEVANAIKNNELTANDFKKYTGALPEADTIYSAVCRRMLWIGEKLYDPDSGLYNHGWGTEKGVNGQYWLRAVGWYAAALADVISMLPEEKYANEREALITIEKQLFDGMIRYQDASGMWYNVINEDGNTYGYLKDTQVKNYNKFETSGTALMAYAMMKAYVEGDVNDTYGEAGLAAFNGTVTGYLDSDGLHNVYISSGVGTSPQVYLEKAYVTNEAKGVGPLIMASTYAGKAAEIHNNPTTATISNGDGITATVGEDPDFSNVTLKLEFDNGTSLDIANDQLTFGSYDKTTAGSQDVDVSYKGKTYGTISVEFVEPVPKFASYSLTLGDVIGVNFFLDLPGDISNYENSYMEFTVGNKDSVKVDLNVNAKNKSGDYYRFTCGVNAIQMATDIKAVFYYGENLDKTVSTTYKVTTYLDVLTDETNGYTDATVNLAKSIGNYGYYAQQYLFKLHNLSAEDYTLMPADPYQYYTEMDYTSLTEFVTDKNLMVNVDRGQSKVRKITYSLRLDSATAIYVYFNMEDGYSGTPTATVKKAGTEVGESVTVDELSDGVYRVIISDISAHQLADMHELTFDDGNGTVTAEVSAMSYCYALVMASGETTSDGANVMAALYKYYEATMNYKNASS